MEKEKIQNQEEQGATMVEYVLLAALIAVVCIVAIQAIGQQASLSFSKVQSAVSET